MKLKEPINFLYKLSSYNFLDEFNNSKNTFLKYEDIISLLLSNYKDVKIFLIKKLKDFISQDNLLNKMNYTLLFFNTYSVLMDSEKENPIIKILILENIEEFFNLYLKNNNQEDLLNQIYYISLIIIIKALKDKNKDVSLRAFLIINKFIDKINLKDKEIIFRFLNLKDKIKFIKMNYLPLSFFINIDKSTLSKREKQLIINNLIENLEFNKIEFEELLEFYLKYNNILKNETNKLIERYIKYISLEKLINIINFCNSNLSNLNWIIKYLILLRLIEEIEINQDLLNDKKVISFLREMSLDENSIIRKLIINSNVLPYYLRINAYKKRQIKLRLSKSLSINYIN
ncbi:MAG: hypothetical protein ACP5RD_01235 [bacterium]